MRKHTLLMTLIAAALLFAACGEKTAPTVSLYDLTRDMCAADHALPSMSSISSSDEKAAAVRGVDPLFRAEGSDRLLCAGLLSGMCGLLVHCYFENIFEEPYMMAYFWGLAAVLLSFRYVKD